MNEASPKFPMRQGESAISSALDQVNHRFWKLIELCLFRLTLGNSSASKDSLPDARHHLEKQSLNQTVAMPCL